MQKGDRSHFYELRDPHVQRFKLASKVSEDSSDLEELQPLQMGSLRHSILFLCMQNLTH